MDLWNRDMNAWMWRAHVRPEARERFQRIVTELLAFSEGHYHRGCAFAFHGWGRDINERVIIASWNEDVLEELYAQPEFRRLATEMKDCVTGQITRQHFRGTLKDRAVFDRYPAGSTQQNAPHGTVEMIVL